MENLYQHRFGWQFFQLNKIVTKSEALVYEDTSIKGVIFTVALAFFILMASAGLLRFTEASIAQTAEASASEIQTENIVEEIGNKVGINPLLVLNKILGIKTAQATTTKHGYSAKKMIQSQSSITLPAGQAMTFQVGFKNTGSTSWKSNGKNYVSIYNRNFYKDSFRHKFWYTDEQPTKLNQDIKPGEIGYLKFALQAPDIPGEYIAKFQLAAENLIWIPGGELHVPFTVPSENQNITSTSQTKNNISNTATDNEEKTANTGVTNNIESTCEFSAFKLIQSHKSPITLQAGSKVKFRVGYKNNGATTWTTSNIYLNTSPATYLKAETKPGQLGYFEFELPASASQNYNYFLMDNNGNIVSGGELNLQITVNGSLTANSNTQNTTLSEGPVMRVGLYKTEEPVIITANKSFKIIDKNNNILKQCVPNERVVAEFNFNTLQYSVVAQTTSSYIKFISDDDDAIFTITNYESRPNWNQTLNDNQFRGSLELRYGRNLWVINELPIEDYLKGVAETSNVSPYEYLKTMTTAARTYALYHYSYPTKHAKDYFIVDATYDQVYKGYGQEKRMPNLVKAVDETNGEIVTYNNEIAITPYFSRSDGRTRSWTEVWSGSTKPWLVSVPAPYDAGKTLWGHGVGLSAWDSLYRAKNGDTYDNILKHFYTGTELTKKY